jgi:SOS response regulatory protein OraA/RecX
MASESEIRQKAREQGIPDQEISQVLSFGSSNPNLSADQVVTKYKQSK